MNKNEIVNNLTIQAQKQFPEFKGINPQVKWTLKSDQKTICTLTFQTSVKTSTGKSLYRRLKVVGGTDGKILKINTSK